MVEQEVAGELEQRQRGARRTESECTEEAKEPNGEKKQEVEGQSGGGTVVL